ncbi:MAG: winged helix-turn-helix domain-containing protein [Conexivisphaerales archaeon]
MKDLSDINKRIVLLIAEAMPIGLTPFQIRQKIPEMTPQNLHMHLKVLLAKGILEKHKEGILTYYRIAPTGINIISRLVLEDKEKVFIPSQKAERAEVFSSPEEKSIRSPSSAPAQGAGSSPQQPTPSPAPAPKPQELKHLLK